MKAYVVGPLRGRRVRVIIDNEGVVQEAQKRLREGAATTGGAAVHKGRGPMDFLWDRLARLMTDYPDLTVVWVPSHGKTPDWTPPRGESAEEWRALNKRADEQATRYQELTVSLDTRDPATGCLDGSHRSSHPNSHSARHGIGGIQERKPGKPGQ